MYSYNHARDSVTWNYRQKLALIYAVALFLDRLDLTIVNVTLPTVARYFHVPITATDWVSLAFLLALAISIPISHWLSERWSLKTVYLWAMLLFGLGSVLCVWAPSMIAITVLRFIQGLGGGLLIPVGMTLLYQHYEPREYASITSFTFIPSLIAPAIAPFFGGVLLDTFGWRTVFVLSGPIVLLLAIYASCVIQSSKLSMDKKPLDVIGFVGVSLLFGLIFLILSAIGRYGFSLNILLASIVCIFVGLGFILWEKKCSYPLIHVHLFRNKLFMSANLIQTCFQIVHFGAIFLIGMYLQVGISMQATMAGLMMGMQAVGAMVTNRLSVRWFHQFGAGMPIMLGLLGIAILSPCILLISHANMIAFGLSLFFVRGLFSGLCGSPIQTLSIIHVNKTQLGQVNSMFNASRQIAISLGIALSSVIMSVGLKHNRILPGSGMNYATAVHVFGPGFMLITAVALLGIGITSMSLRHAYPLSSPSK